MLVPVLCGAQCLRHWCLLVGLGRAGARGPKVVAVWGGRLREASWLPKAARPPPHSR